VSIGALLANVLWKAALGIAVCAWFYGAYHMVARSFCLFGDPDDENRPSVVHERKAQIAGAIFMGLVLFALVVGVASHQF
jgi:hypothetical protein